jgi:hypothetical protein
VGWGGGEEKEERASIGQRGVREDAVCLGGGSCCCGVGPCLLRLERPSERTRLVKAIFQEYIPKLWFRVDALWSSGQSSWLLTQRSRIRFPALPDFMSSSGSGTGSTQPL